MEGEESGFHEISGAALKKAKKGLEVQKKKQQKELEKAKREAELAAQKSEEEMRRLEESKSIVLKEDPSWPAAVTVCCLLVVLLGRAHVVKGQNSQIE